MGCRTCSELGVADVAFRPVEVNAVLLERQSTEVEYAAHLGFQVVHHVLVHDAQHEPGQHFIPVVHQAHVGTVVTADLGKAVGELLAFPEQLLEAAEATRHGVAPRIYHPGVGEDEPDQPYMHEIVGHLVDEQRRSAPVDPGLLDVLLAETPEVAVVKLVEYPRIARVLLCLPPPQPLRERQDVVQFHGAVHEAVGSEDLFKQGRARARQSDDEDRIAAIESDLGPLLEQRRGAGFHLRLRASFIDLRPVAVLLHLEGVAPFVVFERGVEFGPVFQGLAGSEAQVDAVLAGDTRGLLVPPDVPKFFVGETVGLGVGQAPEGIAEVGTVPIGLPVGLDSLLERAHGLLRMPRQQVQFATGRVSVQDLAIERGPFFEPAEPDQGGGEGGLEAAVLGLQLQEVHGLFVGLFELCLLDQDVRVVDARLHVVGRELDATLEQELRIVVDLELRADLGQQAHGLDVMPMPLQEVPAELLGLVEPVFVNQISDVHQFRRQPLQEFESLARACRRFSVPVDRMQFREGAPTGDECRVPLHRPAVRHDRFFPPALSETDVPALLPCAGMSVVLVVQGLQCRQGFPGLVVKTLCHRKHVHRFGTLLVVEAGCEKIPPQGNRLAQSRRLDQLPGMVKRRGSAIGAWRPL